MATTMTFTTLKQDVQRYLERGDTLASDPIVFEQIPRLINLAERRIARELKVVEYMSHRVAVMYLGRVVEIAPSARIYDVPKHPYTRALLSAIPVPDPTKKRVRILLEGDVPSPLDPPSGCTFYPRCPIVERGLCDVKPPPLRTVAPGHEIACHKAEEG